MPFKKFSRKWPKKDLLSPFVKVRCGFHGLTINTFYDENALKEINQTVSFGLVIFSVCFEEKNITKKTKKKKEKETERLEGEVEISLKFIHPLLRFSTSPFELLGS